MINKMVPKVGNDPRNFKKVAIYYQGNTGTNVHIVQVWPLKKNFGETIKATDPDSAQKKLNNLNNELTLII